MGDAIEFIIFIPVKIVAVVAIFVFVLVFAAPTLLPLSNSYDRWYWDIVQKLKNVIKA